MQQDYNKHLDDYEEIELIEDEVESVYSHPVYLELEGLLIVEEVQRILELCNRPKVSETNSLPLYIRLLGVVKYVGEMELSLDNILDIYSVSQDYTLNIVDKESGDVAVVFSKDRKLTGESVKNFINILY